MYRDNSELNEVNTPEISKEITMPYGNHKGKPVRSLPTAYLMWLADNIDLREPLLSEVESAINQTPTFDDCVQLMLFCEEITSEQAEVALLVYRRYQATGGTNG